MMVNTNYILLSIQNAKKLSLIIYQYNLQNDIIIFNTEYKGYHNSIPKYKITSILKIPVNLFTRGKYNMEHIYSW